MKKLFIIPVLLLMIVASVNAFSGSGSGTEIDPYVITDCFELQEMNDGLSDSYILGNDIDCSITTSWNGGKGFIPVGYYENGTWTEFPFTGVFDGQNHTISSLFMDWQVGDGVYLGGLFGYTVGADIRNVVLANVDITCNNEEWGSVGGFGGQNSETNFTQVAVTGYLEGSYTIGGISGEIYGNIVNSYAQVTLGVNQLFPTPEIGGLAGYVGHVGGSIDTMFVNSYAVMDYVEINYSDAQIFPLGATSYDTLNITSSYFDCEVYGADCSALEGKTTAEMMSEGTFTGWDFASIWTIDEGTSYPYFIFQIVVQEPDEPIDYNPGLPPGSTGGGASSYTASSAREADVVVDESREALTEAQQVNLKKVLGIAALVWAAYMIFGNGASGSTRGRSRRKKR